VARRYEKFLRVDHAEIDAAVAPRQKNNGKKSVSENEMKVDGSKLCEATDAADVGSALLQGAGMQNERHRTRLLTNARAWRLRGLPDGAKDMDQLSAKKGAWL
jgi:hypothetical protein